MNYSEDMDCKIFVDADSSHDELVRVVAQIISGTINLWGVQTPDSSIDIRKNDDFDVVRRRVNERGFLCFPYYLEIYPIVGQRLEIRIALVASLLEYFWSQGWPAVAACDYEEELPENRLLSRDA